MFTRSAIFFPLVMAALLAIVTYWISQTVEQQGAKIDGSNRHDPDYMMSNFVTSQTDATGKLRYVLAATEMIHYPDDDSTTLQRPRITQYATDKPYTRIEGLRGYISNNGDEIQLVDNVKVTREAFNGKGVMQIDTEKLTILPNQDIAKTDSPVVITQAPNTVIHANGMVFRKKDQTVQLNNRVKVHYERPSPVSHIAKPITKSISGVSSKPNTIKPKVKKAKIVEAKLKPVEHKKQQVITKKLRSKK
jgi:lipopolysaccharide export system protein LptC